MNDNSVYQVNEIYKGAWAIGEGIVRFFLITGSEAALLIDAGEGGGDLPALIKELTSLPVTVVITHSDGDHTNGLKFFNAAYMHPAEFENFHVKRSGITAKLMPLWEGDIIDLGGVKLEAILIPGHTSGSIALYERERNVMFTGDSVSIVPIWMFNKGRDLEAYIHSIKKLIRIVKSDTRLLVSHGPMEQDASLLPHLLQGAKDVLAGKVKGADPGFDAPALLYDCGEVKFMY